MRPRPLYDALSPLPVADVLLCVREALAASDAPCAGHVGKQHLNLHIAAPRRHIWSPWISIELRPVDGGTHLRGYFGPHPSLWGIFTALYATQVFLFLAALMYGAVSAWLGLGTIGLWLAGGLLVSLTFSCVANIAGEWAGAPQMAITRSFLAHLLHTHTRSGTNSG